MGSIESTFSQLIANRIAYRNMITGSDVNDDETIVVIDDDDDDDDVDDDDDDDDGDDDVLVDKYKTLLGPAPSTLTSPVPHPITSPYHLILTLILTLTINLFNNRVLSGCYLLDTPTVTWKILQ